MATILKPKTIQSDDTIQQVDACYSGKKWVKEIKELFPDTTSGCINFGYWKNVPETISIKEREESQLELYQHLINFAGLKDYSNTRVLEVGCGRGHGVKLLSNMGMDSYGVDLVKSQIKICSDTYPELQAKFKVGLSNKTSFKHNTFDFVISVEAAQHFHSFYSFCREAFRVLKAGGKLAITTFFFPNKHCAERIKNFIPDDISGTHRAISIQKAEDYLIKSGFHNFEKESIGQNVFKGFCQWANQSMSKKNHTPKWIDAFENNLLDYFVIKAVKPPK